MLIKLFINKLLFTIVLLFAFSPGNGQLPCVKHWAVAKPHPTELDTIFSKIQIDQFDSIYCDSFTLNSTFDPQWYVKFYNRQLGIYFFNPRAVSFGMVHFKDKNEPGIGEVHIVEFELPRKQITNFIKKYGAFSPGYKHYKLLVLTNYRYLVKGNFIYFISSETMGFTKRKNSLFDQLYEMIKGQ